nr:nuclear transport factor 2 family protein [Streptomyces venezuelae]
MVTRFNDRINARDLDGLADLMSEDHTFTDTAGSTLTGKADCLQAWAGFFAAFPDYRNVFTAVSARGGEVTATGRSSCSALLLDGPARWTARVRDGLVTSWQVHEAAPDHNHDRDDGDDGDDRDHNR